MNDSEVDDVEMGPGMDLVVSILAFVILVLAILALERKASNASFAAETPSPTAVEETDSKGEKLREIERLTSLLSTTNEELKHAREGLISVEEELKLAKAALREKEKELVTFSGEFVEKDKANSLLTDDLAQAQKRTNTLEGKLAQQSEAAAASIAILEKEKADEVARLGRELSKALALLAETNKKSEGQFLELEDLVSKIAAAEDKQATIANQLQKAREENQKLSEATGAKVNSLSQQIQALQRLLDEARSQLLENRRRIPVELSDSGDLRIFEAGKASLTTEGRIRLYQLIPELTRAIALGQPNVLRVAGHASPERMAKGIRQGFDNNLQLSAERSLTIAYELTSLGFSLRCISIEGHGRSRSPTLKGVHADFGFENFDIEFEKQRKSTKQQFLQRVARERRVEVLVTRESEGQCSHALLVSGAQRASTEARNKLSNR